MKYPKVPEDVPCRSEVGVFDATIRDAKEDQEYIDIAKAVCLSGCEIFDECLEWAMANGVEGVWAATTLSERRSMLRRQQRKARQYQVPRPVRLVTIKTKESVS